MTKTSLLALATVAMVSVSAPAFAGFGEDGWSSGGGTTSTQVAGSNGAGDSQFVNGDERGLTILGFSLEGAPSHGFVDDDGSEPLFAPIRSVGSDSK